MLSGHIVELGKTIWAGADERALAQRTALVAFMLRAVGAVIAYVAQVVMARWMGGFEYGIFIFVWVWVTILGTVVGLGFNTSILRFFPYYLERKDLARLRGFLLASRTLSVAMSTFAALIAAGIVVLLGDRLESYYVLPIVLALICLPLYTLTDLHDGLARANNWVILALAPNYIVRPLLILIVMAGAIVSGYQPSAVLAVLASIAGTWVAAIWQFLVVHRRLSPIVPAGDRRIETGDWVKASLPLVLVEGLYMMLANTDVLVLSRYHDPDQIAVYFAALKTLSLVQFVAFGVAAAATHRFSQYHAAGDRERLAAFARDSVRWTFWPSLAAALLILALGRPLLSLFGEGFTAGYGLMFILAVGLVVRAGVGPIEGLLNMLGHQNLCAMVLGATVVVNLALNVLLIPWLGLTGAAIATSASIIMEALVLLIFAKRRAGLSMAIWQRS